MGELQLAWHWREKLGLLRSSQALRVFHGPGEGSGDLKYFAVDRFGEHFWVTIWEHSLATQRLEQAKKQIIQFYEAQGARSMIEVSRMGQGKFSEPRTWMGTPPQEKFVVQEEQNQFRIQFQDTKHPGLFLDHLPLRRWLQGHSQGLRILNTFAYTGSLSIAAGKGGAHHVTTLDLSRPTLQWAQENWALNGLSADRHRIVVGDFFEWAPRLKREKAEFDCVILDPPSFSRGKKGVFSTSKDLTRLHSLALQLLADGGILVTSINSANVTWKKFEADLENAARQERVQLSILKQIDLPETFPTLVGDESSRYLKGWILRTSRGRPIR